MRIAITAIILAASIAAASPAQADARGDAILAKHEQKFNNYKDQTLKWKLFIKAPGQAMRTARFKVWTRPGYQRLVKLYSPGDVKGMMILVSGQGEMYTYLPAFRKVRRLAGHVRNQGFLGSGFNYDDMAISKWTPYYNATLVKETPASYFLRLDKKAGATAPYPRIDMRIPKKYGIASQMRYYNQRNRLIKTQIFAGFSCRPDNSHCAPWVIKMIEHTRGNTESTMKCAGLRYDRNLPDSMFTVRYLHLSAR